MPDSTDHQQIRRREQGFKRILAENAVWSIVYVMGVDGVQEIASALPQGFNPDLMALLEDLEVALEDYNRLERETNE